ncbi:hypothetical protein cyc_00313 [Cyclospora cayetanensis]|uniref:Uncharacterized protein n=1 Tax=Cyclospora cayetanensis TaxID=88456 RepID=A0A1D3CTD7_9EIME|nr:hypothetical protein cyc_00313 [Cyclospora cayetanensis]
MKPAYWELGGGVDCGSDVGLNPPQQETASGDDSLVHNIDRQPPLLPQRQRHMLPLWIVLAGLLAALVAKGLVSRPWDKREQVTGPIRERSEFGGSTEVPAFSGSDPAPPRSEFSKEHPSWAALIPGDDSSVRSTQLTPPSISPMLTQPGALPDSSLLGPLPVASTELGDALAMGDLRTQPSQGDRQVDILAADPGQDALSQRTPLRLKASEAMAAARNVDMMAIKPASRGGLQETQEEMVRRQFDLPLNKVGDGLLDVVSNARKLPWNAWDYDSRILRAKSVILEKANELEILKEKRNEAWKAWKDVRQRATADLGNQEAQKQAKKLAKLYKSRLLSEKALLESLAKLSNEWQGEASKPLLVAASLVSSPDFKTIEDIGSCHGKLLSALAVGKKALSGSTGLLKQVSGKNYCSVVLPIVSSRLAEVDLLIKSIDLPETAVLTTELKNQQIEAEDGRNHARKRLKEDKQPTWIANIF